MSAAPTGPVTLTYQVDEATTRTETFDYLIVACDPRALAIKDCTEFETQVKDALSSFTFYTSLYRVKRPDRPQLLVVDEDDKTTDRTRRTNEPNYAVRFHPGVLTAMDGRVYGFRDEVYAHDRNLKPDKTGETYCVTYQLEGKSLIGRDPAKVRAEMEKKRDALIADDSKENKWFDWKPVAGQGAQPEEDALVDYFGHFTPEKLDDGLPWKILDRQGERNTFYVASFTCFESVLHCYLYAERLMDPEGRVMKEGIFPADKSKKFAVIGAGPSGLLFASQHLMKKGYTNFKIFEQSSRFGGKTLTQRRTAPGDGTVVPCELGTCYLSPAYEAMWWMFKAYGAGEVVALDRGSKSFNAIIDNDVAKTEEEREDGVEYGSWTVRKNGPVFKYEKAKMLFQSVLYVAVHYAVMGMGLNDCMPDKSPDESSVVENIRNLVGEAKNHETTEAPRGMDAAPRGMEPRAAGEVGVMTLLKALRAKDAEVKDAEAKRNSAAKARNPHATPVDSRGLFNVFDDIGELVEAAIDDIKDVDVTDFFSIAQLEQACKEVFRLTFGEFLDRHSLGSLKSIFVYAYQVQGYGVIEKIPCYYGLVWITPATMLRKVKFQFNPPAPGTEEAKRGTVNIITAGWLALWEKIVEKDLLADKIVFNANITSITRST